MKTWRTLWLALLLGGCSESPVEGPPSIRLGQDECIHCGMIISDERASAAAIVLVDQRRRHILFDDIGDLFAYERAQNDVKIISRYVHDYDTREWVDADRAVFVHVPGLSTPMGSGLIAFADPSAAQRRVGESGGAIKTLQSLRELTLQSAAVEDHAQGERN